MNRLEQAFEDKYRADHRDPMVAEDLARFTDGWSAALSAQQAGTGEPSYTGGVLPLPKPACVHGGGANLSYRFTADQMHEYAARCMLHAIPAPKSSPPSVGEPMYQIRIDGNTAWHDASEGAYDVTPAKDRRIVYASPPPSTDGAKPAGGFPFLQKIDTLIASVNEAHLAKSDGWRDGCFAAADAVYEEIKAALAAAPDSQGEEIVCDKCFVAGLLVCDCARKSDSQGEPKPVAPRHFLIDLDSLLRMGESHGGGTVQAYAVRQIVERHFKAASDGAQAAGQDARDAARYRLARSYEGNRVALFTIDSQGNALDILIGGHADNEIDAAMKAAGQEDAS